jgi:2-keto-4-pentenoate hydratase
MSTRSEVGRGDLRGNERRRAGATYSAAMPLSPDDLDRLASLLWSSMQAGDHFPPALDGLGYDDGLALQVRLLRRHQESGAVLSGWKVGLTSARARDAFGGIDVRPFGYLDAAHTLTSGATVPVAGITAAAVETEFCFTIGERLVGAGLSVDAVRAAVSRVAAGYEINQRPPGTLRPDLAMGAAIRMFNWGIVEGSGASPDRLAADGVEDLADVVITMTCVDGEGTHMRLRERTGDHVDDHYHSIGLLAAALADHDLALEPGQKIITGAVGRFPAAAGQIWRSDFAGVGTVEVQFT